MRKIAEIDFHFVQPSEAQVDAQRLQRWITVSSKIGETVEIFMMPLVQGLGRLDCQLWADDERFLGLSQEAQGTIEEAMLLTDRMTLSYLWVLGAYEFVRTLHQRLRERGHPLERNAQVVKQSLNRLRIPLAKMEAAGRSPDDSPIAFPALNRDRGIAWQLTETEFLIRTELANQLLEFLEQYVEHEKPAPG